MNEVNALDSRMEASSQVILFVDDEPSILSSLRRLFRPLGYEVLIAESAQQGLEVLEKETVDLVISDMRMPEMDGAAFLEQVRERWPHVQRMLLTGYADIASTIAAINRGEIHRYIAKPWDDQQLLLSVRESLSRRELERENTRLHALTKAQNEELQQANELLEQRVKSRTHELEQVNGMLRNAFEQLEENYLLSMDVFAGLMELRDQGAAGYSREVAQFALRLAQHLELSAKEVQDLYISGLLHEIGKMSLPDGLLDQPYSSMSADDQTLFLRHPLEAEAALMPLPALNRVSRIIRAQMERVDGKGSPDGLKGDEFTQAFQILAISAQYHRLIWGRHSEQAHKSEEAEAMIVGQIDSHFSMDMVLAFQKVLAQCRAEQPNDMAIDAADLRAGMVLARDLVSSRGTLLLATGFRFDERVVKQIHTLVQREGVSLTLHVQPFKLPGKSSARDSAPRVLNNAPKSSAANPATAMH